MMWFLLLLLHTAHIELVVSEAVNKLIIRNSKRDNPCEGHVEVYHNSIWGYVGDEDWSNNTAKVVCESTHCGHLEASGDIVKTLTDSTIWLNELKCNGDERALWECDHPGWNASFYRKGAVKYLRCSSKINISLDRANCAGAVQYSDGLTSGYFCNNTWGNEAANLVCESLGCRGVRSIPPPEWMLSERFESSSTKMKLDCSAFPNQKPDNLWQCVTGEHDGAPAECKPAPVICTGYRRLQLKGHQSNVCSGELEEERNGKWEPVTKNNFNFDVCQQMHCGTRRNKNETNSRNVTCTDEVKVVLGSGGGCSGTVNIRVNGSVKPVCASSWTKEHAEFVCKELNCGKLIYFTEVTGNVEGVMDHIQCNGTESSLWHCQGQHGTNIKCSSQPKVVCSESVKVKLVDGPGTCAGRLEIMFEGHWRRVTDTSWTNDQSAAVCKKLGCGDNGKTEKFSQGSGEFITVDCAGKQISDISECLKADSSRRSSEGQAVGIICDDHMDVFLKGSEACSGQVRIKDGNQTYWLSGSHATWNQTSADTVCQQMHCGTAASFKSISHKNGNVWNKSYNCSSIKKSLFDCKITDLPPAHQNSIAYVNCSGKIVMNLTKGCSGKVRVHVQEVHGDMCADTWTEEKSSLLCKNLGCGTALKAHNSQKDVDVNIQFNSLHATPDDNANLTKWKFVRTQENDKSCSQRPAYVVCSGSVKPRFSISSEHCSGNIEVEYEGERIPVCSDALKDPNTQNTICQELKCGNAVKLLPYFGPDPAEKLAISNLSCSANAKGSLSACSIATSQNKVCKYSGLQCAEWKVMFLVGDYACRGTVLVHSGRGNSGVSAEGWSKTEKDTLCKDMNCGGYDSADTPQDMETEFDSFYNKSFSCSSNTPANIWECEKETPPSEKNALFIKCQGEPNVSLSHRCHGEVRIDNIPVCARNWDLSTARKICQKKRCGNAIKIPPQPQSSSDTYHVSCDKYYSYLGKCRRIKGKCAEGVVSISCSGNVTFRRTEQNGGFLEVKYRGDWEKVCLNGSLSDNMRKSLCIEIKKEKHGSTQQGKLDTTLECVGEVNDIKRCVKQRSCGGLPQAAISCDGDAKTTEPPRVDPPPLAPIIVGVVLLLLVVILIVLFIRFCVRRARKSKVSSRMLSAKDMEFESGEYEDVMNKENEMEDFNPGRFRSEDEFITENDRHSVSSLPYDDIDEADEARPLTSPGSAAPADPDASTQEDGVTYEVEEPQESYDDIDTIHETTETKAEVHDGPQTTHDPAAPPGLVQGDEDYLEPDQDG